MALSSEKLDLVAINEVGAELAAARDLVNKSSSDFVLDLRTTKHHINAIESGDLRIFYGPPFYIDLMKRYAKSLNFSEKKVLLFEKRVLGFFEEKPNNSNNKLERDNSSHLSTKSNKQVFTNVKLKRETLLLDPEVFKTLKEKNDRFLIMLVVLVVVLAGLVFILPKNLSSNSSNSDFASEIEIKNKQNEIKLFENNEIKFSLDSSFSDIAFDDSKKTNSLIHNQTKDLTTENISKPSNMEINLDQVDYNRKPIDDSLKEDKNTIVQIPDVSLLALQSTWFWIRYADDSIKEFMVNPNTKTEILEYPIYLVIGNPERVEMFISGSKVLVERNDPNRNLARFTRTELQAMVK